MPAKDANDAPQFGLPENDELLKMNKTQTLDGKLKRINTVSNLQDACKPTEVTNDIIEGQK